MTSSRALVSFTTVVADESFRCDDLKLCCLWYDEILFQMLGEYDASGFFSRLIGGEDKPDSTAKALREVMVPLTERVSREVLDDVFDASMREGYPRWGDEYRNYNYPDPETPAEYAHNRLLDHIALEHGVSRFEDGYDIEQAEGLARNSVNAVTLWARVNAEVPCMLQANAYEKIGLEAALQFSSGVGDNPVASRLLQMALPSLSGLTWRQVVDLRRNAGMDSLRALIRDAVQQASGDLGAAKTLLSEFEARATDRIVEAGRPNVKKVAFEAIMGNLPGLAVNPFSVFFGARDTLAAVKKRNEFGWLYLLRDIRRAAGGGQ